MLTPITQTIPAFDASQAQTFYFQTTDSISGFEFTLYLADTGYLINTWYETTTSKNFTLPSSTLSNGFRYKYTFKTISVDGQTTSAESMAIPFYCYTTPTFTIDITSGTTLSSSFHDFTLSYSQAQGEKLSYAVINLYNGPILLQTSGKISGTEALTYRFTGLNNATSYQVQGVGVTVQNTEISTSKISFNVSYSSPSSNGIADLSLDCEKGNVVIENKLSVIDGISNPSPPIYPHLHSVNLLNSGEYIYWNSGFAIDNANDFTLKVFGKSFTNNSIICILSTADEGSENKITLSRVDNTVVAEFYSSGTHTIVSNSLTYSSSTEYAIYLTKTNDLFTLKWQPRLPIFSVEVTGTSSLFPKANVYTKLKISNGQFGQVDLSNGKQLFASAYPTWNDDTILNCDFINNIYGGSLKYSFGALNAIRIKRQEITSSGSTGYIQISKDVNLDTVSDINFTIYDFLCGSGHTYEYAIVPILTNNVEGSYFITPTITPSFDGVYISDADTSFKLHDGMSYGGTTDNKDVGLIKPIGRKYPIVVSNSKVRYKSGSVSGSLLGYDFISTRAINRNSVVEQTNDIMEFLNNGNPKVVKDWNGNIWLVIVTDNPSVSYDSNYGMGTATLSFNWVEQGEVNNQTDLSNNNFI